MPELAGGAVVRVIATMVVAFNLASDARQAEWIGFSHGVVELWYTSIRTFSGAEEVIRMAYGRLGAAMVQSLERVWWADEARRIQRL